MANRPTLPKPLQVAVFQRDGWLCCWCKRPVIFAPVMKFLDREITAAAGSRRVAYYHAHWTRDGAPLLDLLGAVIDHIEAFSTGGASDMENLATACNKCNGRKSAAPLDKWGERPTEKPIKGKYGEPQKWDGLSSVFVILAQRAPAALTASEKDWLRALRSDLAGYNHRAPVRQSLMTDPMNSSEVIIKLGAEGGSVTLYGTRAERGWHFIREVDDCTPELIDEECIEHQSAAVDSWEAALGLLDQYPWYRLHPIVIHPDFRERILLAVQQRLRDNLEDPNLELKRWRDFCQ